MHVNGGRLFDIDLRTGVDTGAKSASDTRSTVWGYYIAYVFRIHDELKCSTTVAVEFGLYFYRWHKLYRKPIPFHCDWTASRSCLTHCMVILQMTC